jgi:NitT/TauT family transport system ATP-binding protein
MCVIKAVAVSHWYESSAGTFKALEDLDITVGRNEFVCLLGPSGCGKSTFLKIVAGLIKPTAGDVRLHGERITEPGLNRGIVFQEPALFPWLTVVGNVEFGLLMGGSEKAAARERAEHVLGIVGLAACSSWYPYQLSGGMKNRAAVARAWALEDADVLLMDEPFSGADAITRVVLQDHLIKTWQAEPRTVLFVTHDVEEAVYLADRIVVWTPSPGRIGDDFRVNLPRPRDRDAPEATSLRTRITSLMHELASSEQSSKVDLGKR